MEPEEKVGAYKFQSMFYGCTVISKNPPEKGELIGPLIIIYRAKDGGIRRYVAGS